MIFSFKCYVVHSHTIYSSGNIDVRNWVHLFKSRFKWILRNKMSMCGLPSSWSGLRLQAGSCEHTIETIGFHRISNSWTVELLLASQEGVCFVELVVYINAFGGQDRNHICGVWPQLRSQTCLKTGTIFMYPFSFKSVFKSLLTLINPLSAVHLRFSLWRKDKGIGQGSVI